jgi:quinol monooxygenase YgiN
MTQLYIDPQFPPAVSRVFAQLAARLQHEIVPNIAQADFIISPENITPPLTLAAVTKWWRKPPTIPDLAQGWQLQLASRTLINASQKPLHLTERECLLLHYLLLRHDQEITQEMLMREVWRYDAEVQSHTLETHIYRLRGKLEMLTPPPCTIATTDNGYLLTLA